MSLIHLQSNGQNPCDFFNVFPQQINIGKHAEICVKGYSGILRQGIAMESLSGSFDENLYIITEGNNDEATFYHGETTAVVSLTEVQGRAFSIKIPAGEYNGGQLATMVTDCLNQAENNTTYVGGWTILNATNRFTVQLSTTRNQVETAGNWVENRNGGGIVVAVGSTTLQPFIDAEGNTYGTFINQNRGILGQPGLGALTFVGYSYNFTTEGSGTGPSTLADIQMTMGIVPNQSLTQYERDHGDPRGTNLTLPIGRYTEVANSSADWAAPAGKYPWVAYGMTVNPMTGQVGIITSMMKAGSVTPMKNSFNQTVEWLGGGANRIDLTGVADKQHYFCIKPGYSAGNEYQLQFCTSINNVVGPAIAWLVVATKVLGSFYNGDDTALLTAASCHQVVYYDPDNITNAVDVVVSALDPDTVNQTSLTADPLEDLNIQWAYNPINEGVALSTDSPIQNSELKPYGNQHANMLGLSMGYTEIVQISQTGLSAAGLRSDVNPRLITAEDGPPFLITCPDLPIQGYIGAADGGGQSAPILAVGTPMSSNYENAFQVEGGDTWIALKNEYPIRLTQLNIRLVDEHNRSYNRLLGNFSCWLQVKCPYRKVNKETEVVGQLNNYNGNY